MPLQCRHFMILEFKRSPRSWLSCLQGDLQLAACSRDLNAAGHSTVLDELLPKVFVAAEDLLPILAHFGRKATFGSTLSKLRQRHIITDDRHYPIILEAVGLLPRKDQAIQMKNPTSYYIDVHVAEIRDDIAMPPGRIPAY